MNWLTRFRKIWHFTGLHLNTSKPRHPLAGLLLLAGACIALVAGGWPVFAAVELVDYQVRSTQNDILLLWNTAHEYDLSGFDVMCKQASEPDTAYHPIGFREAQGGPQRGGQYFFLINRGLTPAQTYCFRLQEKTTNDQPGEVFDRCGYGLGITPTPTLTITAVLSNTGVLTNTTGLTNTSVLTGTRIFTNTAVFTSVLMISGTPGIALPQAVTNNGVFSTVATITPAQILPTPVVVSPLQTPTPTVFNPSIVPTVTPLLALTPGIVTTPITNTGVPITNGIPPTVTIIAPPPSVPVVPTPFFTPTSTVTQTSNSTPSSGAQSSNALTNDASQAANGPVAQAPGTPNPPYVVVTSTPLPTVLALPIILTPLSTATAEPSMNLASLAQPGMQNIVILLLCFTFLGASGLGVVGLLTSVLYMRSRNQDRDLNGAPILIDRSPKRRIKL